MQFKPGGCEILPAGSGDLRGPGVPVGHEDEEFDALQKADGPG